jgi:hypothetical protein
MSRDKLTVQDLIEAKKLIERARAC